MITLHRINQKEFVLNADLIKYVESTPDTLITLTQGNDKIMVMESKEEVLRLVEKYKRNCFFMPLSSSDES